MAKRTKLKGWFCAFSLLSNRYLLKRGGKSIRQTIYASLCYCYNRSIDERRYVICSICCAVIWKINPPLSISAFLFVVRYAVNFGTAAVYLFLKYHRRRRIERKRNSMMPFTNARNSGPDEPQGKRPERDSANVPFADVWSAIPASLSAMKWICVGNVLDG